MVSTPTTLLGFEKQGQSDNVNAWWQNLDQLNDVIDDAIAGVETISTTAGDTTLTTVPYATDQSRMARISIDSGGNPITANIRVLTGRKRTYVVSNNTTSGSFTVAFGDVTSQVVIPRGYRCYITILSTGGAVLVSPFINSSTGEIDVSNIPDITVAMLDSALAASLAATASTASSASSQAATALSTANSALSAATTAASESTLGVVRLASTSDLTTGTDTAKAATAAGVKAAIDARTASDSAAGIIRIGTQAEMEAASSTTRAVTPGRQQFHPGHPKAGGNLDSTGTPAFRAGDYGMGAVTDNGSGLFTCAFDTAFADTNYWLTGWGRLTDNSTICAASLSAQAGGTKAAGSIALLSATICGGSGGAANDLPEIGMMFWGDYA